MLLIIFTGRWDAVLYKYFREDWEENQYTFIKEGLTCLSQQIDYLRAQHFGRRS